MSQKDYFPFVFSANAVSDGDKESECDEDGLDDTRKVSGYMSQLVLSFAILFFFIITFLFV